MTMDNCILFDWLSFTSSIDSVDSIKSLLGLSHVTWLDCQTSFNGYMYRIVFNNISICYGVPKNVGGEYHKETVLVNMSGQGCRAYETYSTCCDWHTLFAVLLSDTENYNITRLDVAYDDFSGVLDIPLIVDQIRLKNVVTKFNRAKLEEGLLGATGEDTLYIGSRQSDLYMRIYNKAAERNRSDEIPHWVRWEVVFKKERALNFIRRYHEYDCNIGKVFSGVICNYIRFVTPSETDSNKRRWDPQPWFVEFVHSLERISVFTKKDVDYNLFKLKNTVINLFGNATRSYIRSVGVTQFYNDLISSNVKMNPKYDYVVRQARKAECFDKICKEETDLLSVLKRMESEGYL